MTLDEKQPEQLVQLGRFAVTSIVTLILVLVFSWGFLTAKIDNQVFTQVVGMVIAYWFGAATARTNSTPSGSGTPATNGAAAESKGGTS